MVRGGPGGPRLKVSTQTKILSPNIRYFVTILRFVAISVPFLEIKGKKVLFWVKFSVFWTEVPYEMVLGRSPHSGRQGLA